MAKTIVIGAGVIGCSVALELARRGEKPLVVDRLGSAGHGSTSASCGIVRCFYSTKTMTAMAREGSGVWSDWQRYLRAEDGEQLAQFEQPGMLFIPPVMDESFQDVMQNMRELGAQVEYLSSDEVKARFPFLNVDSQFPVTRPSDENFFEGSGRSIAGAIFEKDAGYVVSPMLATENLKQAGLREGVSFQMGLALVAIEPGTEQRFLLKFEDGSGLEADVVVNVAGPHSKQVNAMAGVDLGIETRALRREVHALPNPCAGLPAGEGLPILGDLDGGLYSRPEAGGAQIVTGSLDPECDELEWIDDPDEFNTNCTNVYHERQVMRLMKRLPSAELAPLSGVAGLYDVTLLDWNPVLDRTSKDGFYVALGTSGSSFKTAPIIGQCMAELIGAVEGGSDHDTNPVKVQLERTGFELDMSFFSRLRSAHASTQSVIG
jgi:sarcosine oxidase subunit beta